MMCPTGRLSFFSHEPVHRCRQCATQPRETENSELGINSRAKGKRRHVLALSVFVLSGVSISQRNYFLTEGFCQILTSNLTDKQTRAPLPERLVLLTPSTSVAITLTSLVALLLLATSCGAVKLLNVTERKKN